MRGIRHAPWRLRPFFKYELTLVSFFNPGFSPGSPRVMSAPHLLRNQKHSRGCFPGFLSSVIASTTLTTWSCGTRGS